MLLTFERKWVWAKASVNHPAQKRVQPSAEPVLPDALRVSGLLSKTEAEDQILDGAAKIFPETKQKIHKENKQKYALENLTSWGVDYVTRQKELAF